MIRRDKDRDGRRQAGTNDKRAGVNASVRPRVVHRHKGDVGRAETNEEIFQGAKQKELQGQSDKPAH
jgi:hypothetical protein